MALTAGEIRRALERIARGRGVLRAKRRLPALRPRRVSSSQIGRRDLTLSGIISRAQAAAWTRRSIFLGTAGHGRTRVTESNVGRRLMGRAMKIDGTAYRTIWPGDDGASVVIIDQTRLPHYLETVTLRTRSMMPREPFSRCRSRGAPLIGATAAYGLALALQRDASDAGLAHAIDHLARQRPTAVNLKWALEEVRRLVQHLPLPVSELQPPLRKRHAIAEDDVEMCRNIGVHGVSLIRAIAEKKRRGEAGQHPDALQRGLAGLCRLGHRDLADLPRA